MKNFLTYNLLAILIGLLTGHLLAKETINSDEHPDKIIEKKEFIINNLEDFDVKVNTTYPLSSFSYKKDSVNWYYHDVTIAKWNEYENNGGTVDTLSKQDYYRIIFWADRDKIDNLWRNKLEWKLNRDLSFSVYLNSTDSLDKVLITKLQKMENEER